jgi:hypothetical protein
MTRTVSRLFDDRAEAQAAVRDLEAAGIHHDRISFVSSNADNWHHGDHVHSGDRDRAGHDRDHDGHSDTGEGAAKGATTGGVIGGVGGLLAGLGMLAIPGLGPVVAAGWLASTAAGAAIGAAAGGAAGGILGALKDAGHSDEEANVYAEGIRRGSVLVSVRADDAEAARAEEILHRRGGADAATRGAAYREAGWSRFDETAPAWGADEIEAERRLRRESRTFAARDPSDDAIEDEARRDYTATPSQRPTPDRGL